MRLQTLPVAPSLVPPNPANSQHFGIFRSSFSEGPNIQDKLCPVPASPRAPAHPLLPRNPCLEQHDVVVQHFGVVLRVYVVLEDSPDLLGFFWFVDVVSPQDDCDVPGRGSGGEKEKSGWVSPTSLILADRWSELPSTGGTCSKIAPGEGARGPGEKEGGKTPVSGTHPMQCAADITQSGATRKPPQPPSPAIFRYAMYGCEWGCASWPPMI